MNRFAQLDHRYVWHPFTQMRDWLSSDPIVISEGEGALLRDTEGREYIDANSSIWTNLHGHGNPHINRAIKRQLKRIAHSSALGLANEPASLLAEQLVRICNPDVLLEGRGGAGRIESAIHFAPTVARSSTPTRLEKVFFSDDGSTAMEVALKLSYEHARRSGRSSEPKFLSLDSAYHGDTIGSVSLGHIDLFHDRYAGLLFNSEKVMSPYCYRCPFNRAEPERGDAREYRKCRWECVDQVEQKFAGLKAAGTPISAFVVEPLIQGAAGMIPHPRGWLRKVAEITRSNNAQLVADEVMTGFGRTGGAGFYPAVRKAGVLGDGSYAAPGGSQTSLFACHQEGVQPDFMALAKGLTGGYLPMAATLTTQGVFDAFLGDYSEFKTFFHGHSFTANQLGSAAACASIELLESRKSLTARARLETTLRETLPQLWTSPYVGDVRQVGLIAGVELVKEWRTRQPFDLKERVGVRVCETMAKRGVLTRPIGNVIVIMPPYCTSARQVQQIIQTLKESIADVLGGSEKAAF